MATNTKTQSAPKGPRAGLRVRSRSPFGTFRRAGLAFGEEPTIVAVGDLLPEQIDAIKGERMLVVEEIELPAADEASA